MLPLQGLVGLSVAQGLVCATAERAGLKSGDIITEYDVIVEVDKKAIKSVADLRELVDRRAKGKPMLFRIQRQDASLFLTVIV